MMIELKRRTDMGAKRCIIESKHRHPKMGSYPMIWTKIKIVLNLPNIKYPILAFTVHKLFF